MSDSMLDFSADNPASPTETREEHTPPRQLETSRLNFNEDDPIQRLLRVKNGNGNDSDVSDLSDNDEPADASSRMKSRTSHSESKANRRGSRPSLPSKSRPEVALVLPPTPDLQLDYSTPLPRLQLTNNLSDSLLLSKKKRHANGTTPTIKRRSSSISFRRRRRSSIVNVSLAHSIVFSPEPIVKIHNHQHELKRMSRLDSWMCAGCGSEKRRKDRRFRCTICPNVSVCERQSCKEAHNHASVSTIEIIEHPDGRREFITPLIQSNTNHDGVDPQFLSDHKNFQYITMNENGEYSCSMCRISFGEKDDYNRYRCSTCDDFDACATCVWKNLYHIQGGPWLSKLLTITDVTGKSRSTCPSTHTEFHDLHLVNRESLGGSSSRRHLMRHANRARLVRMRAAHTATTAMPFVPPTAGAPPHAARTAPASVGGIPPPGAFGGAGFGAPPARSDTDGSESVLDGSLERVHNMLSQLGGSLSDQTSTLTSSAIQWASSFMSESERANAVDDVKTPSNGDDSTTGDTGDISLSDFSFPPPASVTDLHRSVGVASDSPQSLSPSASGNSDTPSALATFEDLSPAGWAVPPRFPISRSSTDPLRSTRVPIAVPRAGVPAPSATPPPHIGTLSGIGSATYPGFTVEESFSSGPVNQASLNARATAAAGVTDWVCGVCRADKEHEHARRRCGVCENFDVCDRVTCVMSHQHPLKVVPYDLEFKSSCVKCCRSNVTNRWLCHTCDGDISFCNKCIRKTLKIANALSDWTGTDWDAATDFVHDCLDASPHFVPQHRTFTYWSYKYCIMEDEDLRSRLVRLVERGIEHSQTTLHVLWVFLCSTSLPKTSLARVRISEEINAVCRDMMARRRGDFTSAERNFVKFCLAFCYPTRYGPLFDELQATAREVLDELTRPLINMYDDMVHRNSNLITIHHTLQDEHYNFEVQAQQHILPPEMMTELLEWYDHEKIDDVKATKAKDFCEKWEFHWDRVLKLRMKDGKFHAGRITLNMFKEIAEELQHSFQNVIARIFEENRSRLNLTLVSEDYDVGPRAPEPKTISRAQHKSFREFSNRPNPREGYILDFLRAVVVCESEEEAVGFFRICANEAFKGQIINVSNGFDRDSPTNFGYRALHLNVLFESPSLSRARLGRKMIMEIQIILRDFLRIRKKMHLYNKIVRAREQWAIGRDFSKMWDL